MRKCTWVLTIGGTAVLASIGLLWFTGTLFFRHEVPSTAPSTGKAVPQEYVVGEALFNAHCTRCHGRSAVGTDQGPSLLWKIYAPNHHSDASFYLAVQQGVRAHHWHFGNMPPIIEVTQNDVTQIISYVRWLQMQVGIR
jgi:hypothetical protein